MSKQAIIFLNMMGILIISSILCGAYYFQFGLNEFPCPLCLLQRMCFFGVIFGLFLNMKFGLSSMHYGLSILSALLGAAISIRQILLHICPSPGDHGYGTPVLGVHLYTWALLAFVASIVAISLLLLASKQFEGRPKEIDGSSLFHLLKKITFGLVLLLLVTNLLFAFMECGLGPCPDDPVSYQLFDGKWW